MRGTIALLAISIVAAFAIGCGSSGKKVPGSVRHVSGPLIGTAFGSAVLAQDVNLGQQLDLAVASGVESLRVSVDWSTMQPYETFSTVPRSMRSQFQDVGGVPTNFTSLDRIVGAAAMRDVSILPTVGGSPSWAALQPDHPGSPPKSPAQYAAFLTALVMRYGPGGTFWSSHPSIQLWPIRMWQIWNEPHFTKYWSIQPFAPTYVRLLAAAHAAIKAADPGATVVLAGLADFSWQYLAEIYQVPGARRWFDTVAIHPYTANANGLIIILQHVRAVMDQYGDAKKPIMATEITWPSSQGKAPPQFGVGTTEAQQGQQLNQAMPLLAASSTKLGLAGFYWYTWMGDEGRQSQDAFDYAGLLKYVRGTISAKPALTVFKRWALSIEGCGRKTQDAATCA